MNFAGKRVTIMGLGRFPGGVEAARWLAEQGACVTITDTASESKLAESIQALHGVSIERWQLGSHDEADFQQADYIVVNPAIKPGHPLLEIARQSGARLTSEIELFLSHCPTANIIGVTGSNGKSTTTAMTAAILRQAGKQVWLGGNIGKSLLPHLKQMKHEDWVLLELSSFQLSRLSSDVRWPSVAIITNCTPNHLDWHPDYHHYRHSKQRLITQLPPTGLAVFDPLDPELSTWQTLVKSRHLAPWKVDSVPRLQVPGVHNRQNAALAAAAAEACGANRKDIEQALVEYEALPHRLQQVAEMEGRRYFNDSLATTPEAALTALFAFDTPVWLLCGGADKGSDFAPFCRQLATHAAGAAFYGSTGPLLHSLTQSFAPAGHWSCFDTLAPALSWCTAHAQPGHNIVLAPACASFDQFTHFAQRGEFFTQLVHNLTSPTR